MSRFDTLVDRWRRYWARRAGPDRSGRLAATLAAWAAPPYLGRVALSRFARRGYISPEAEVAHSGLTLGEYAFIGERVVIFQDKKGGGVSIGARVHIHRDTTLQTGHGGAITIGAETHIQPRCQLSGYVGAIRIGERVEIAPGCAFYPYNHQMLPDQPIRSQPVVSKGDIVIEDDAWLGYGVVVLDGVRIGRGAVVGAGSVVTRDVPPGAIAAGNPARTIKHREELG